MTNILLGLLDETSARRDELGDSIAGIPPFLSNDSCRALVHERA